MKKIFISLSAAFCLQACADMLQEKPKSLAVQNFYNTSSEIESALFAVYVPLRDQSCLGGLYPALQEALSDYFDGRGGYLTVSNYAGLDPANVTKAGQIWDLVYQGMRNANLVIQNAPKSTVITADDAAKFVAEARYLRALMYFFLVRNWGGVPLRTENNLTIPDVPRSSADDIYQLILDDLKFADINLPSSVTQSGRPTQFAAKTVLADVYLQLGQYDLARDKAKEVINSGNYSLVPVSISEDFLKVFGPDVTTSSEEVFDLKFRRQDGQGFQFVIFAHHPASGYHGAGGFYSFYGDSARNSVLKTWDKKDLRKAYNLYKWDIGLGKNTVLNRKFRDPLAPTRTAAANDYPLYRYADVLLMHAEAASRAGGGPTAEAVESLNQVHRRAYGKDPKTADVTVDFKLTDYDAQSFADLVIKERGYETMFEGKRWTDLKRLGTAKQVIKLVKGKTVADKAMLWPIPISEINFNKAIDPTKDQNPGY